MGLFGHRHNWDGLDVRFGDFVPVSDNESRALNVWVWACECGQFMVSLGTEAHVELTGKFPLCLRDAPRSKQLEFIDLFLPAGYPDRNGVTEGTPNILAMRRLVGR